MVKEDPELQVLRERRLAQIQQQRLQEETMETERSQYEEQTQDVLRQIMTPEAKERLGRVRLTYPEIASGVENQLIMLYQSGRLPGKIDDPTLKKLLGQLQNQNRKEIKIVRK